MEKELRMYKEDYFFPLYTQHNPALKYITEGTQRMRTLATVADVGVKFTEGGHEIVRGIN